MLSHMFELNRVPGAKCWREGQLWFVRWPNGRIDVMMYGPLWTL